MRPWMVLFQWFLLFLYRAGNMIGRMVAALSLIKLIIYLEIIIIMIKLIIYLEIIIRMIKLIIHLEIIINMVTVTIKFLPLLPILIIKRSSVYYVIKKRVNQIIMLDDDAGGKGCIIKNIELDFSELLDNC